MTYAYCCEVCGEFEAEQPISAKPLAECPSCGGEVKRLIATAPPVRLLGPRWASDGYGLGFKFRNG